MVLSNTVDKMLSEDYKERFIAEYQQLIRRSIPQLTSAELMR